MKLSIITINRNNAAGLKRTLDSVKAQTCQEFEHIIIDGASTDDSVMIIESYVRDVSCMKYDVLWVSEPDTGIYNAMNKGCKLAKGEYTLMLNSGDYLVNDRVLERILPELHDADTIQGNELYIKNGVLYRDKGYGRSKLLFNDVLDGYFHHQTTFIRKSLLEEMGYYDDSYQKGADTYFFIKALGLNNASFRYVDIDIAHFDMNGIASGKNPKWIEIGKKEDKRFYEENIPRRLADFYKESNNVFRIYQSLKRSKALWKLTMLLVLISAKFYGPINKTIVEKVRDEKNTH